MTRNSVDSRLNLEPAIYVFSAPSQTCFLLCYIRCRVYRIKVYLIFIFKFNSVIWFDGPMWHFNAFLSFSYWQRGRHAALKHRTEEAYAA